MESKTKQYLTVTVIGVTLFVALLNYSAVLAFAGKIINLILPVIVGCILALFISVPMKGIEKRLKYFFQKSKRHPSDKWINIVSFVLTMICIALVLVLALTLLIPELIRSFQSLYMQIAIKIPQWIAYLNGPNTGLEWIKNWIDSTNWEEWLHNFSDSIDVALAGAVDAVSSTVNIAFTAAFAFIISIYISLGREKVCRHTTKLIHAYMKPKHAENFLKFCRLFRQSFSNFLTGQCGEAVILGLLMTLAFTIFKIPYGSLVGVLTAICAIIPYVGAFISCSISVLLVLLVDPLLALRCLIVYLAVQFIENQFIYPRVVGKSVGMPPLYTLVSAMIGGKLFGIIGIIFFIPLAAVIIELVREDAERRLHSRKNKMIQEGAKT